jgi:hypothetical protein
MTAPGVVSVMVTDCGCPYVPGGGLNVGVAAGPLLTVVVAVAVSLVVSPFSVAPAVTVAVTDPLVGIV